MILIMMWLNNVISRGRGVAVGRLSVISEIENSENNDQLCVWLVNKYTLRRVTRTNL